MTETVIAIVVPALVVVLVAGINAWWQARINKQTLDHQRKLAVQARVVATYEEMLEMVGWQMEVVDATKPIFAVGDSPKPPQEPEMEHIRKVQARIGVHGSTEVKSILERWARQRNVFFSDAWLLDRMQNDPRSYTPTEERSSYGATQGEQWKKVDASRKSLHSSVRELEDAVSGELRA